MENEKWKIRRETRTSTNNSCLARRRVQRRARRRERERGRLEPLGAHEGRAEEDERVRRARDVVRRARVRRCRAPFRICVRVRVRVRRWGWGCAGRG